MVTVSVGCAVLVGVFAGAAYVGLLAGIVAWGASENRRVREVGAKECEIIRLRGEVEVLKIRLEK